MTETTNVVSLEERFKTSDITADQRVKSRTPDCPDWLNDAAKAHWPELVKDLSNHGIINELDKDMLAVYCSTFARYTELDERLDDPEGPGMTQKTKSGYEAETATFTAWKSLQKPLMTYAKQLGLTPPARVALKLQNADPDQETLLF